MSIAHYDVIIATPGRNMENEYVRSLMDTVEYLVKNNISFKFANQYSPTVAAAREGTIMNSLFLDIANTKPLRGEATYNKIIWIDSDMSWTVEDFIKIYESDKDIISGVYINEKGVPMFSMTGFDATPQEMLKQTNVFEAAQVGFGFVGVKQGVFEAMPRPWFDTIYNKYQEDGKEYLIPYGEDFSWCIKAARLGYKVYVDPNVRLGHHKKVHLSVPW
jgi:hypothetical protein